MSWTYCSTYNDIEESKCLGEKECPTPLWALQNNNITNQELCAIYNYYERLQLHQYVGS
uniref:Uncharacterized protein n=1 Tax=Setaria italica TaxID=4555 RepID=K3ZYX3_SETIT